MFRYLVASPKKIFEHGPMKDWEPYRDEILRLWMVENLTLDQVGGHMSQEHGFNRK